MTFIKLQKTAARRRREKKLWEIVSNQNHTLTHRQTDTTKPLLHSNKNKLARAVKVDTSANSNQRFSVIFLISLVHIENRTSKKTHTRRRQENIKNKQSQTNTNKRKNSAQQKKNCKVSANKMSNLDADDGVAVHGAKEDFFCFLFRIFAELL